MKLLFIGIFFVGCWTTESNIDVVSSLKYGFKIITDSENLTEGYQLVFDIGSGSNTSFRIIEKNCKSITYDSSKIYIKSLENETSSKYRYSILKIDESNYTEYTKEEIKEIDFLSAINNCKFCTGVNISKPLTIPK